MLNSTRSTVQAMQTQLDRTLIAGKHINTSLAVEYGNLAVIHNRIENADRDYAENLISLSATYGNIELLKRCISKLIVGHIGYYIRKSYTTAALNNQVCFMKYIDSVYNGCRGYCDGCSNDYSEDMVVFHIPHNNALYHASISGNIQAAEYSMTLTGTYPLPMEALSNAADRNDMVCFDWLIRNGLIIRSNLVEFTFLKLLKHSQFERCDLLFANTPANVQYTKWYVTKDIDQIEYILRKRGLLDIETVINVILLATPTRTPNQSLNQSTNQSTNQSPNQSPNRSPNQSPTQQGYELFSRLMMLIHSQYEMNSDYYNMEYRGRLYNAAMRSGRVDILSIITLPQPPHLASIVVNGGQLEMVKCVLNTMNGVTPHNAANILVPLIAIAVSRGYLECAMYMDGLLSDAHTSLTIMYKTGCKGMCKVLCLCSRCKLTNNSIINATIRGHLDCVMWALDHRLNTLESASGDILIEKVLTYARRKNRMNIVAAITQKYIL
tara:strand:+ start:8671 stop:10155 length:1485 start_codon:yes stop_codon:yes gene_type:complete